MKLRLLTFAFFFISVMQLAIAQAPPFQGDEDSVPIDGGIGLLIGAGALYGIKKLNDRRKRD